MSCTCPDIDSAFGIHRGYDSHCPVHGGQPDPRLPSSAPASRATMPWNRDAPEGQAWKCPDCESWATLGGNAAFHANQTGHGPPTLQPMHHDPSCPYHRPGSPAGLARCPNCKEPARGPVGHSRSLILPLPIAISAAQISAELVTTLERISVTVSLDGVRRMLVDAAQAVAENRADLEGLLRAAGRLMDHFEPGREVVSAALGPTENEKRHNRLRLKDPTSSPGEIARLRKRLEDVWPGEDWTA